MIAAPNAYSVFPRAEWRDLRANTPLVLSDDDISRLRGANTHLSLDEVADIFLPLSRLLNLQIQATRNLSVVRDTFLGRHVRWTPYIIGVAGSVAVGKSTFARALQAILSRWPEHPRVALVTTDGFLYANAVLQSRGLLQRKGFPESYDLRSMIAFLAAVKACERAEAPVYSHVTYDLLPGRTEIVDCPDILIFEGLNVLQAATGASLLASDFFDFSVYIDAEESDIAAWFLERFRTLQQTAFQDAQSYFHRYRDLPAAEAIAMADQIWKSINLVNLRENISPTRERARVVLRKRQDHRVDEVWLRRV